MVAETSIGILETGGYVPEAAISSEEVAKKVAVTDSWLTDEWITRKTRIVSRRYAAPGEATSDLAARAAEQALERSGLAATDLDYLIVSTSTGDSPQPPTAHLVQKEIQAYRAACLDINVVCSGFVYALALAQGLVAQRPGSHALVVAAEVYSRFVDFTDRRTAVLMGDGAGAAVVGQVPEGRGFLGFELVGRGDAHGLIRVEAGGSRIPPSAETVADGGHFLRMEGRDVRNFVNENLPPAVRTLTDAHGLTLGDVQHFVPHQPNGVMLDELVEHTGLEKAQNHRTVEQYGNMGSASVAYTLHDANLRGRLGEGDLVLLAGFGGGMSIGAGLLRWGGAR
ncbi:3-oxoacyl-[acyl-carrier-protein] synthase 3 [Streptomyces capitiformicae]|uniref:3-oxoacyl-[acyl-carrier-protein] synthase 3 n=1 Tax=Streptomyces capitiformicae TaxID=2014920 RepID=A0A919DSD9_9ACTN|nr:3-oxoacyl-[acyl-carrier-protein] synthase 3 [Streptomyces capitiformicae]